MAVLLFFALFEYIERKCVCGTGSGNFKVINSTPQQKPTRAVACAAALEAACALPPAHTSATAAATAEAVAAVDSLEALLLGCDVTNAELPA